MNKELEHAIQHVGIHLANNKDVQKAVVGAVVTAGTVALENAGGVASGVRQAYPSLLELSLPL